MDNNSKFIRANVSVGLWLYNFVLLQFLTFFSIIKGFIFLGIFPSIASAFYILYRWINNGEHDLILSHTFNSYYKKYFKETNQLGWSMTGIGLLLVVDLYISSQYIQSILFHSVLIGLIFVYIVVCSYLFTVFARYDYPKLTLYFKQSFFIGLTSIAQSLAIIVAVIVMSYLFEAVPFMFLFFGIPVMIGIISWFAVQGIHKAEEKNSAFKNR